MSTSNIKKSKVPEVALKLADKVTMTIPEKSMLEIDYLCTNILTIEWSGVLFFKITSGSIENQNMCMEVLEVYPMHKGTAGSTGYKFTADVGKRHVELMKEHKCMVKIGMIHSHHNMKSYFSGVDMDELNENSENHNWYLSVVVNNAGDIVAKVGYRAETEVIKRVSGPIKIAEMVSKEQTFLHFDVEVIKAEIKSTMPTNWLSKFKEINRVSAYSNYNHNQVYGAAVPKGYGYGAYNSYQQTMNFNQGKTPKTYANEVNLTQSEILALMADEGIDFDKFQSDEKQIIHEFLLETLQKLPSNKVISRQDIHGIMFNASTLIQNIPIDEDAQDFMFEALFSYGGLEAWIVKNNKNLNTLFLYELLTETIRKAAYSGFITSNKERKQAAALCQYLIDCIIEIEEGDIDTEDGTNFITVK